MSNSYAQQINLTCPQCRKTFIAEAYLIVDIAERLDLLERIWAGTLHDIPCLNCDYKGQVNMPLLIFRPDDKPHILFSPAQGTTQEEDQQQARELVEKLKKSLRSAWQDDWLKDGFQGVQRQVLPAALSDNPEAAMQELAEKQGRELERLKTENPEQYLQIILNAWLDVQDFAQKRQSLEDAPELLSEQAEELLKGLLEQAQNNKDEQAEQFFQRHLDLLAACRLDGVAVVFEQLESQRSKQQAWPKGLGEILEELNRPTRLRDMPHRIELCQQALDMVPRETQPELWSIFQNELANSLAQNPLGKRDENLEQAIEHYQQALQVRTQRADPEHWAMIQNNLGGAYADRIRGERAENLEQAIEHYQQALEVRTPHSFPEGWANIKKNLGTVYAERTRGERAENLEQAIYQFQQALEIYTRQDFPQDWAQTQNNLGNAYSHRTRGKRAENIEQAIQHYQQALEVFTRQAFSEDWALTQNNLGSVYFNRIRGERTENIERAIRHFQKALEVYTRQTFPKDWAMTQHNLASVYNNRIRGGRAKNVEQAIHHYKQALKVRDRKAFPEEWAMTMNNLGIAYVERVLGRRAKNIEQAIHQLQQALEVYTWQAFPQGCRNTAQALGEIAFNSDRWELARDAYGKVFAAQEIFMQASFTRLGKQAELNKVQNLPRRAAYVQVQLGNLEQAVEVLEQGRAQLMREALERQRQDLEQLPALGFERLYKDYLQAIQQYDVLQSIGGSEGAHSGEWVSKMERTLQKVQAATSSIREEAGKQHPQYRYFLQALPFADIQKQALEKPLVYLCATSAGGLALIVTEQGVQTIEFPELNQTSLQEQLRQPSDEEWNRIQDHIQQGSITSEDIQAVSGGYLSMYRLWGMISMLVNTSDELKLKLHEAWFETLDETTRWLWDAFMGRLVTDLKQYRDTVILIPTGRLSLLPLHAAWTADKTKPSGRLYALDELCFSYAPSAYALWQTRMAAERPADTLMAVDNPDGTLIFSEDEVQAVLDEFEYSDPVHLHKEKATFDAVTREMQKAHVLHFSTHGTAGWENPEDARLTLADGYLTLPDIFKLNLDNTCLAVLSACETGVPGLELIDEMIGLPAGMMQAGVPGVVGSLWSVSDMSTSILMARFYSLWRGDKLSPQEALRQAQIWLRDSTTTEKKALFDHFMERQVVRMSADTAQAFYQHIGWDDPDARLFASPYFWAAFTYTGI